MGAPTTRSYELSNQCIVWYKYIVLGILYQIEENRKLVKMMADQEFKCRGGFDHICARRYL